MSASHGFFTPYVIPSQVTPQRVAHVYLEQVPFSALNGDTLKFIVFFSFIFCCFHSLHAQNEMSLLPLIQRLEAANNAAEYQTINTQLEQFASSILVGKQTKDCEDESCSDKT